jgi:uncharacterized GH25 family protein
MIGAALVGLLATAAAQAHALYIVANLGNATTQITVVFSDDLKPDPRVKDATWKKLDGTKLKVLQQNGKVVEVATEKGEACLKATYTVTDARGSDPSIVFGTVDYGVSTKGEKASRIVFYPKAIVGAIPEKPALGDAVGLEVVPKVEGGKVRFQVLAAGKPVKDAKVRVMLPKDDKTEDATTDEAGWTQALEGAGRYGVTVRHVEPKDGELNGTKYEQTSHVATLVVDVK